MQANAGKCGHAKCAGGAGKLCFFKGAPMRPYAKYVKCTMCAEYVHPLDAFSKGECLACHEKHFTMPTSGAEVAAGFVKSINI